MGFGMGGASASYVSYGEGMRFLALVAFGCAAPISELPSAAEPVAPIDSPVDSPEDSPLFEGEICRAAREKAFEVRRETTINASTLGNATAEDFVCAASEDFNGDGVVDFTVTAPGASVFYLFLQQTPAVYVGQLASGRMFGFSCTGERVNGMCIIGTDQMMIHGETMYTRYQFNGDLYAKRDHRYSAGEP